MDGSVAVFPLVLSTIVFLAAMSVVFGIGLALTAMKFFVKSDPKVEQITEALAHAHCGACGFAGCEQYAEEVVNNPDIAANLCTAGGKQCAELIAQLTGKIPQERDARYARIMCQGGNHNARKKFSYEGFKDCRAAVLAGGGDKSCPYGCLGYGTCMRVCPFGAISMGPDSTPVVDEEKCTGCKKCVAACPKKVIEILPASARILVVCHSTDKGGITRKYCTVGCTGCLKCVKICPVSPVKAAKVENNLSRIDNALCTSCGQCVDNCPTKAIIELKHK